MVGTETGTQLVLTAATAPWYPLTHAKSSAKSTRRAGVPCAEPIGRQDAPLRQGRRLRDVPAGHDRGAPAVPDPHPVLLRLVQPLAFAVWPDADGQVTAFFRWLAHTYAMRWRVAHRTVGYGHLYQGRSKSFPVQSDEHLLTVLRYIERNAVGAGLVTRAERWSGLWARMHGADAIKAILSPWPVERSVDWTDRVNAPLSAKEFGRVRVSIERGRPFGEQRRGLPLQAVCRLYRSRFLELGPRESGGLLPYLTARPDGRNQTGRLGRLRNTKRLRAPTVLPSLTILLKKQDFPG